VVGQVTAELRLLSTEASVTMLASFERRDLGGVLSAITDNRDPWFSVNDDFMSAFFSLEADDICPQKYGSGCSLASRANPQWVRKSWQDILGFKDFASVKGLICMMIWSRYRGRVEQSILRSHGLVSQPQTCNHCPFDEECASADQSY
jgi:hypothetical protein